MRKNCILIFCTAIVHYANCQLNMGMGDPAPSVGISNNYHDVLLSLLSPNPAEPSSKLADQHLTSPTHNKASTQQTGLQPDVASQGNSGFSISGLMEMIAGGSTSGNLPNLKTREQSSPVSSQSTSLNSIKPSTIGDFNSQNAYFAPAAPSVSPPSSGSSVNSPSHSLLAALELASSHKASNQFNQPSNSGINPANSSPGNALTELLGTHPASQSSRNPMVDSLLRGSSGHPVGQSFKSPTLHKEPTHSSILGNIAGSNPATKPTSAPSILPSGAATQGTTPQNTLSKPNVFQVKMQAKLYNIKVSKMAPIIQLYEQEGCINPTQFLPTKISELAKSTFSGGCQDPNANHYCHMAQLKTPGFSSAQLNTQLLLQNLMTPESKTRIGTMLSNMSPANMMTSGSGLGGMMLGLGGGEMMNPELVDRVQKIRQRLFPLQCQEVSLTPMFKIGMCCHGQINLPQRYVISKYLSGSFGAK